MDVISLIIRIIQIAAQVLGLLVIAEVILSYFMSPFHPVRLFVNRIISPLLNPIRRVVPPLQMIDFSPLILLILIQVVSGLLVRFLVSLR